MTYLSFNGDAEKKRATTFLLAVKIEEIRVFGLNSQALRLCGR
jgi:hypothetical protein